MLNKLTGIVIAVIAIAMLYMGAQLLMLGGSPFYVIIGVGLLATAITLFMNKKLRFPSMPC